jgi:hypothetical protein
VSAQSDNLTDPGPKALPAGSPDPSPTGRSRTFWIGLGLALVIVLVYQLAFFNRFFPIQEGWFSAYAHQMLSGKTPYKDFYLFLQPIYPLLMTALIKLCGYSFIVLRIWGLFERLVLTGVLYLIFARLFRPRTALIAVLVTVAVYASNTTDVIYSYYQLTVDLALIGVYLLLVGLDAAPARWRRAAFAAAGFFAAAAFFTKQTTGLLVALATLAAACVMLARERRKRIPELLGFYFIGALVPTAAIVAWLAAVGALRPYVHQVYTGAAASKGSLTVTLFGFLHRALTYTYLTTFAVVVLAAAPLVLATLDDGGTGASRPQSRRLSSAQIGILITSVLAAVLIWQLHYQGRVVFAILYGGSLVLAWLWRRNRATVAAHVARRRIPEIAVLVATAALAALAFLVPFHRSAWLWQQWLQHNVYVQKLILVHWCFYFSFAAGLFLLWRVARRGADQRSGRLLLVGAAAFAVMYAHGMSYTIEEHAVAPALGLMTGIAIQSDVAWPMIRTFFVYAACLVVIVSCATQRAVWPYQWWGWVEPPVATATAAPTDPLLRGFRLSRNTIDTYARITQLIDANSRPQDAIFTFPHIPLFYVLSGRYPTTFSLVHYWDVCPDWVARRDARELLRNPPAVIVMLNLSAVDWQFHEQAFRGGHPSGQRDIVRAVDRLVTTRHYRLLASMPATANAATIQVWALPRAP